MKFLSACRSVLVEVMGASFVDDSLLGVTSEYVHDPDLSHSVNHNQKVNHMVSRLKLLAQYWERLLFSTGGAINMQKSHWYLMTWLWTNGIPCLATIRTTPSNLTLTTGHDTSETVVPRIKPTQAYRTLGTYLAGLGAQTKKAAIIRSHSESYKESLQSASLTLVDAYWSYMMFLRPKLTYPLPCCSLT
jgi:hypothetical protein